MEATGVQQHSTTLPPLVAENIAQTFTIELTESDAEQVAKQMMDLWMGSAGHRRWIMSEATAEGGFGFELDPQGILNRVWGVQQFFLPTAPAPAPTTTAPAPTTLTEDQFEDAVADEVFRLVNCARTGDYSGWCEQDDESGWNVTSAERSELSVVARVESLETDAKAWAEVMAATGVYQHSPSPRVSGALENIAQSLSVELTSAEVERVSKDLMDQWMGSSGHRRWIVSEATTEFGSGFELAPLSGPLNVVYAVQHFIVE